MQLDLPDDGICFDISEVFDSLPQCADLFPTKQEVYRLSGYNDRKSGKDSDVIWRLKSPAPQLVVQHLVQACNKGNSKAPLHRPFCEGNHKGPCNPQSAGYAENVSMSWRHHYQCIKYSNVHEPIRWWLLIQEILKWIFVSQTYCMYASIFIV